MSEWGVAGSGLLLGWVSSAQGADIPTPPELTEKYGLSVGMNITAESANLIKDLVPGLAYERTTRGEYSFTIGEFDPPDLLLRPENHWDEEFVQAIKQNAGKFDVDADGGIIARSTGKRPWPMPMGQPFPNIDLTEDPAKVGAKIMWNAKAMQGSCGEEEQYGALQASMPLKGAFDRWLTVRVLRQRIDFHRPPVPRIKRPLIFQEIFFLTGPADSFGVATLSWRWQDPKKWDSVWIYAPANRRVFRATSANRSDSVLGTEFTPDDGTPLYSGKVEMMKWKYIGKQDGLLPVWRLWGQAPDDYVANLTSYGEPSLRYPHVPSAFQRPDKDFKSGYQEDPQVHAGWWNTGVLWVPVRMLVVEAIPKDPYYAYGREILWFEEGSNTPTWKTVFNRSGEQWRQMIHLFDYLHFDTGDKITTCFDGNAGFFADEIVNRGTTSIGSGDQMLGKPHGSKNRRVGTAHFNFGRPGFDQNFRVGRFLEYGK